MFNRWFILVVLGVTITALAFVIYWDSRSPGDSETYKADSGEIRGNVAEPSPPSIDEQRVGYIHSVLDTLQRSRTRLPYYGELIRIYTDAGLPDSAAEYAARRARLTEDREDYILAAGLYFEAAGKEEGDTAIKSLAQKAESLYIKALEAGPEDPGLRTDLAAVYLSLLMPEKAYEALDKALETDPGSIRAHFNMAVLLHQTGNTDESVAYFDKTLSLAENSEWEQVVQGYLDRYHHELFH
ncbi:hypothetical protein QA596_03630 [Balneolales bacterium ANBcel1]|nr:hypothetical protein [Balneolales bacterium ANBcel1]